MSTPSHLWPCPCGHVRYHHAWSNAGEQGPRLRCDVQGSGCACEYINEEEFYAASPRARRERFVQDVRAAAESELEQMGERVAASQAPLAACQDCGACTGRSLCTACDAKREAAKPTQDQAFRAGLAEIAEAQDEHWKAFEAHGQEATRRMTALLDRAARCLGSIPSHHIPDSRTIQEARAVLHLIYQETRKPEGPTESGGAVPRASRASDVYHVFSFNGKALDPAPSSFKEVRRLRAWDSLHPQSSCYCEACNDRREARNMPEEWGE